MPRYHTNSKEVLRDGKHFADCIDDGAARLIADALNERRGMPVADTQDVLPLDGADGPLFVGDRVLPRGISKAYSPSRDQNISRAELARNYFDAIGHLVWRENDEYACSCGARWDVADGEDHP